MLILQLRALGAPMRYNVVMVPSLVQTFQAKSCCPLPFRPLHEGNKPIRTLLPAVLDMSHVSVGIISMPRIIFSWVTVSPVYSNLFFNLTTYVYNSVDIIKGNVSFPAQRLKRWCDLTPAIVLPCQNVQPI